MRTCNFLPDNGSCTLAEKYSALKSLYENSRHWRCFSCKPTECCIYVIFALKTKSLYQTKEECVGANLKVSPTVCRDL